MDKQFFYQLVDKYLDGTATPEERYLVESYYEQLSSEYGPELSPEKLHVIKELMYGRIRPAARVVSMRRRRLIGVAAAAVIFLALAATSWLTQRKAQDDKNIAALPQPQHFKNDIDPAREGALLTMDNGTTILLDSAANGTMTTQGTIKVLKKDGAIAYLSGNEVRYHTIATHKGNSYHLTLADGTQVWLDALSSIHFPTAFAGQERTVEVTGQAYFEVVKDAAKPFKVKVADQTIEVLGTHFNINAFDPVIKTTLLEGAVKVIKNNEAIVIKPGQQAEGDKEMKIVHDVDLDEIMAWKNGRFQFNGSSVEEIMNQLSRWYDIEVVYQDKITETFVATISKDLPVSRLLTLLEMTKQVKFTIEGKKVTVMR